MRLHATEIYFYYALPGQWMGPQLKFVTWEISDIMHWLLREALTKIFGTFCDAHDQFFSDKERFTLWEIHSHLNTVLYSYIVIITVLLYTL